MSMFGNLMGGFSSSQNQFSVKKTVKYFKNVNGTPAVSFDKVETEGGVSLKKKAEAVNISLKKRNIAGIRLCAKCHHDFDKKGIKVQRNLK